MADHCIFSRLKTEISPLEVKPTKAYITLEEQNKRVIALEQCSGKKPTGRITCGFPTIWVFPNKYIHQTILPLTSELIDHKLFHIVCYLHWGPGIFSLFEISPVSVRMTVIAPEIYSWGNLIICVFPEVLSPKKPGNFPSH